MSKSNADMFQKLSAIVKSMESDAASLAERAAGVAAVLDKIADKQGAAAAPDTAASEHERARKPSRVAKVQANADRY